MARNIRENYFEDNYLKYECQSCKRSFIVGERLSGNMNLVCSYCGSASIKWIAAAAEEATEDMELGCLGIHFSVYSDGRLMLYTESEFAQAMSENEIPMRSSLEIIREYCFARDRRSFPALSPTVYMGGRDCPESH